ncbi:hypothetical protein ACJX0J_017798, partial [Zea mays]
MFFNVNVYLTLYNLDNFIIITVALHTSYEEGDNLQIGMFIRCRNSAIDSKDHIWGDRNILSEQTAGDCRASISQDFAVNIALAFTTGRKGGLGDRPRQASINQKKIMRTTFSFFSYLVANKKLLDGLDGAGTSIAALETIWNALGFNVSGPELFSALRGRLYDSNKNLVMATLSTIGGLVSAMGPSVEKSSKGILADVLKCLGDNKKHMRECTLTALDSLVAAAQLEKMDKSSKVRKAAESFMNEILRICGQEMVGRKLKDLPSPTLAIVSERLKLSTLKDLPSPTLAIVSERLKLSTAHEGGVVHIV